MSNAASNTSDDATASFVTEAFAYDTGRQITVYVPPNPRSAFLFAGDGQNIAKWASVLQSTDLTVPPTMVVGVHGIGGDEDGRLKEYSPVFDAQRFAAHEAFFVSDVRQWVESRFQVKLVPERTAVYGASAAGELALAMGIRHPGIFGAVLCAPPGADYRPPEAFLRKPPRAYLVAGTGEPFFMENAQRWAGALAAAGGEVVMEQRNGGHGDDFWREEFPRMVSWAFGVLAIQG